MIDTVPARVEGQGDDATVRKAPPGDVALSSCSPPNPGGICCLVLIILCLSLLATGCSTRFVRSRAERRICQRLEDLIGPAERYKVRVRRTKDAEIVVGRIRRIEIDGWSVRAGEEIELESLHLIIHDLRYHAPPKERLSIGNSLLVIHLTEAALNDFLQRQRSSLEPQVKLNNGTVTLRGIMNLLGVPTPIETTGRLVVVDRTRLEFRAGTVDLTDNPVPGIGSEYVEKHLNPLLDVERLRLPIRLDSISPEPGRVVVRGTAYLPPPRPR